MGILPSSAALDNKEMEYWFCSRLCCSGKGQGDAALTVEGTVWVWLHRAAKTSHSSHWKPVPHGVTQCAEPKNGNIAKSYEYVMFLQTVSTIFF